MIPFDAPKEKERIIAFIKTTFESAGFTTAVIGLSGGIDSAVSCSLAVHAIGADHVYPILLPCGPISTQGVLDAMTLIQQLAIPLSHVVRIDISKAVEVISGGDGTMDRIRKGNIMARVRMIHLFDQAKKRNALVVGTENKSEHMLGYYTRYGDEASDIEPICHLYKTQVFELAKHLHIPEKIQNKAPSADLWPEQTDEKEFGFTYIDADEVLAALVDTKKTEKETEDALSTREPAKRVIQIMHKNIFKKTVPYKMRE